MKQLYMKNETQQPKNIKDVYTENEHQFFNTNTHRMNSSIAPTGETGKRRAIELNSTPNIFLAQNKGKGPPSRQRSPVVIKPNRFHKPVRFDKTNDIISDPHSLPSNFGLRSFHPNDFETITDKKQNDYKFYKFNFSQLLNSIFMKKQLFILILAVFASVNVVLAQPYATTHTAPRPLACNNDALHPIAGKPYVYTLDATPPNGVYTWWATKNPNFISTTASTTTMNTGTQLTTASGDLINVSPNYGAGNGTTANTVSITWSSALLAGTQYQSTPGAAAPAKTPTFVAAYYAAPSGSGCADNFKVYELEPLNGFTVDILNLNPTTKVPDAGTYSYTAEQCVDNVRSATYTTAHQILYDYGVNVLYFEVVAANFTEEWTPTFNLTGLQTNQTADIVWDYSTAFSTPVTVKTGATADGEFVSPSVVKVDPSVTNTSLGVSIYVRVTIHNGKYETLTANKISLGVAGQNKELAWDVDNNNPATADCSTVATKTFEDTVDQLINPRPDVKEGTKSVAPFTTNLKLIDKEP